MSSTNLGLTSWERTTAYGMGSPILGTDKNVLELDKDDG